MTESYLNPALTNGGGFPQAQGPFPTPAPPEPDDFSGDDVWKFKYNFGKYSSGKEIKGEVSAPTQARIDAYQRGYARLQVELEYAREQEVKAVNAADAAKAGEGGLTVDEAMEYVYKTYDASAAAYDRLRDLLADFCAGKPTRKQFDLLPENALIAFNNAIRRKLDPNS